MTTKKFMRFYMRQTLVVRQFLDPSGVAEIRRLARIEEARTGYGYGEER